MKRGLGLLGLWLWSALACADEPLLNVQARLLPGDAVVVGEPLQLQVDVRTSSWFTDAATLPELTIAGTDVTPPNSEAQHLTQTVQGQIFTGLRYTYRIIPNLAQAFTVPSLTVRTSPAQASHELSAQTPPLHFTASQPAGFEPGEPVLVASGLRFSQNIRPADAELKVGDSLSRTLTLQAENAPGLSLPAPPVGTVDGLSTYPKTPQISNLDDGRGNFTGGQRIDSLSYRIERPGNYALPAISVKWWDSIQRKAQTSEVPAISFKAVANPGNAPVFSIARDLKQLGQPSQLRVPESALITGLILLLAGVGYCTRRSWLRLLSTTRHWWRTRPARKTYALRPLNPGHEKDFP